MKVNPQSRRLCRWRYSMRTPSLLLAALVALAATSPVPAQSKSEAAPLPPALKAALLSGNAKAVTQAIATLSGGNPERAATLAGQVMTAAENLVATNPRAALQAASAAVEIIKMGSVNKAAPSASASVLTAAARIFVNPQVQRINPSAATALALNTVNVASTLGNATLSASIASQAVGTAQAVAATDPASAALLASAAIMVAQSPEVAAAQPAQAANIASVASRIIILPEVQRNSPSIAADIAQNIVRIVTNPAVYQISPQGAIQSMANAYATVTSSEVSSAVPAAAQNLAQALRTAQNNPQLIAISQENGTQIADILNKPAPNPTPRPITTQNRNTPPNEIDNTFNVSTSS